MTYELNEFLKDQVVNFYYFLKNEVLENLNVTSYETIF